MKALFELFRRFDARRIFGFIRRLGGMSRPKVKCYDLRSTHALRVEGDGSRFYRPAPYRNFYPRPPGGGRPKQKRLRWQARSFLSTPSGWRATDGHQNKPRKCVGFLSTPSGWRATPMCSRRRRGSRISIHALRVEGDTQAKDIRRKIKYFYPRPPGGGRRATPRRLMLSMHFYPRPPGGGRRDFSAILIHILNGFLSTPSGWRATDAVCAC